MEMPAPDDLADWDFVLPEDRIARHPPAERGASRLMHLPLAGGTPTDHRFADLLGLLQPGDLLVGNDTRVMRARLTARRTTGGRVELLLLQPGPGPVEALARPARKLKRGDVLMVEGGSEARVVRGAEEGVVIVELDRSPAEVMAARGELPLPPYLGRDPVEADRHRYQTVYAGPLGAAAAPTAGLHFTDALLAQLERVGVGFATVTLHVGLGTFRPLRPEDVARGSLHEEWYEVPQETATRIADTRAAGGRVIAVGTTSTRTLEAATPRGHRVPSPGAGTTDLFLRPGSELRTVDGLLTNFHLPRSSLLMLVAVLVGRERLLDAYRQAIARGYRFSSYGDAMLLL
jgi:S-adenosylmethionine:tRNA ribosyltransferase-isomerase